MSREKTWGDFEILWQTRFFLSDFWVFRLDDYLQKFVGMGARLIYAYMSVMFFYIIMIMIWF